MTRAQRYVRTGCPYGPRVVAVDEMELEPAPPRFHGPDDT